MYLIVTVDTEEEGLWGGRYPRTGCRVSNVEGIARFQETCARHGIRPTYLIDAAIVEDDRAVEILKAFVDTGQCEIGSHLHPWCNPPFEEELNKRNSYLCNLPVELQSAKLTWLTEKIRERLGVTPRSFRAGRYGADGETIRLLRRQGYHVDSSVTPFVNHDRDGGPKFAGAPFTPYLADANDICRAAIEGEELLEIPVSVGYTHASFALADRWRNRAMRTPWRQCRMVGVLDRLGFARRVKFCPERAGSKDLCRLADAYVANNAPVLVMMLHSSSLAAGKSPYARDQAQLERLYHTMEVAFQHCRDYHFVEPVTLTECAGVLMKTARTAERATSVGTNELPDCREL